jgi:uncharacterized membrane protein
MNGWYYAKNGQQVGPVTLEHLKEIARSGGLDATKDLVWNATMKDWTPAGQVADLFGAPANAAAPAADPANPDAAPQSTWTEPAPSAAISLGEIVPGSEPIDVGACVKRGFELTTRNFGTILLVGLTYFGLSLGMKLILGQIDAAFGLAPIPNAEWHAETGNAFARYQQQGSPLNLIVSQVLSIFLALGLVRVGLNLVSGKPVSVAMLFSEGRKLLRAFGATILYGAMLVIGFLLLIVPGIYLALRYGQYMTAIVDRDMGILESLSYSSSITTNNRLNLFLLALMAIVIVIAGCLALVVGLIFAYPVIWLSWMVAYRWMQYGHRAAMDQPGTQTPMLAGQ